MTCPCGGAEYGDCCEPLHDRAREAQTTEALMRSRYSAYAVGNLNYVFRTWDPRTRPETIEPSGLQWTGLAVRETIDGGTDDDSGIVVFDASYDDGGRRGTLRERSRFVRRRGRWVYVDAE